jgi:hypothetical protein
VIPLAVVFCVLLAAMAVFQACLLAGVPLGEYAWGGGAKVLPRRLRIGSAVAIALYMAFALVALAKAQALPSVAPTFVAVAIWVIAVYLLLGVAMNAVSRSRRERWVMTPVSLALGGIALALAIL